MFLLNVVLFDQTFKQLLDDSLLGRTYLGIELECSCQGSDVLSERWYFFEQKGEETEVQFALSFRYEHLQHLLHYLVDNLLILPMYLFKNLNKVITELPHIFFGFVQKEVFIKLCDLQ